MNGRTWYGRPGRCIRWWVRDETGQMVAFDTRADALGFYDALPRRIGGT